MARDEQGGPHKDTREGTGGHGVEKNLVLQNGAITRANDGHVGHICPVWDDGGAQVDDGGVLQ